MRLLWERKFILATIAILLFSAVMTVRQITENQSRHAELREAFIFLHNTGHRKEAERLYARLLWDLKDEPTRHLIDDLGRTSIVAPTNESSATNILVRYHMTIQREIGKRFEKQYLRAREVAETPK